MRAVSMVTALQMIVLRYGITSLLLLGEAVLFTLGTMKTTGDHLKIPGWHLKFYLTPSR